MWLRRAGESAINQHTLQTGPGAKPEPSEKVDPRPLDKVDPISKFTV